MRKYNGHEIVNGEYIGEAKFVVFGQMAEGPMCYHKLDENGEEIENTWYSRSRINGETYFFLEAED